MDLVDKQIGKEGEIKIALSAGKLILTASSLHASGKVSLVVEEDAKYFMEKLKLALGNNAIANIVITAAEGLIP